ncbi:MAG TPA: hypothetical protein ENL06_02665 [Candidatus Portnoybacteria bacterium]|nr:hypothetical protein [Candidatus Portnoybacteria bacterium]
MSKIPLTKSKRGKNIATNRATKNTVGKKEEIMEKEKILRFIRKHKEKKHVFPQDEDKMCGKIGILPHKFRRLFPGGLQQAIEEAAG